MVGRSLSLYRFPVLAVPLQLSLACCPSPAFSCSMFLCRFLLLAVPLPLSLARCPSTAFSPLAVPLSLSLARCPSPAFSRLAVPLPLIPARYPSPAFSRSLSLSGLSLPLSQADFLGPCVPAPSLPLVFVSKCLPLACSPAVFSSLYRAWRWSSSTCSSAAPTGLVRPSPPLPTLLRTMAEHRLRAVVSDGPWGVGTCHYWPIWTRACMYHSAP